MANRHVIRCRRLFTGLEDEPRHNQTLVIEGGLFTYVAMPDVPTFTDAGFKDYDPAFWIGLAVPKSTPAEVVATLNAALQRALARTALKARAQAFGWTLVGGPPSVLSDSVNRDVAAYRTTISGLDLDRQ